MFVYQKYYTMVQTQISLTMQMIIFISLLVVFLNGQGCLDGCFQCNTTTKICTACYDSHQLTIMGQCLKNTIPNCNLYLYESLCMRCIPTYTLTNNTCNKDKSGCFKNITAQRCSNCSPELTLKNGICMGVFNCKLYTDWCVVCMDGFVLVGLICQVENGDCLVSDGDGICQQCREGFRVMGYKCVSDMFYNPNCELYNEIGQCYYCKDGYVLFQSNCYGRKELENIRNYSQISGESGNANVGNAGNSSIERSKSNISELNFTGFSTNNTSNTVLTNGTIQLKQTKSTPPPSAQQYPPSISSTSPAANTLQIPTSPNNPSPLISPPPSPPQPNNLNLYCKNYLRGICVQCYKGYYLKNNNCLIINPLCKFFNLTSNKCQNCYIGYMLNNNATCVVAPPPTIIDVNCQKMQGSICIACYKDYHIKYDLCVQNNPLCKEIFLNGSCKSCYEGYQINEDNCTVIIVSQGLANDPFCVKSVSGQCKLCVIGYFVGIDHSCLPLSLNCITHDLRDGSCLHCLQPYQLHNQVCILLVQHCITYNTNNKCTQCQPGYYFKDETCISHDQTCASIDSKGNCIQCINTFYLINGQCIYPTFGYDPLCINYQNSYCTACQINSFLLNYRCQSLDQNCSTFDYKTSRCITCLNGLLARGPGCI